MKSNENSTPNTTHQAASLATTTEDPKIVGLESPLWFRNTEQKMLFGLKVDQVTVGSEILILGWLVGTLEKLELRVNGKGIPATFSRSARPDVAQALGFDDPSLNLGFELHAYPSAAMTAETQLTLNWSVEAESGEIVLRQGNPLGSNQPTPQKISPAEIKCHLDKIEGPCLNGWLVVAARPAQHFSILANDRPIGCDVLTIPRKDVAAALGVEAIDLGFQIIIPGYVWEGIALDSPTHIQLLAEGLPCLKAVLTRKTVVDWIESLVDLPNNSKRQYLALLALEHIQHGNLSKLLSPEAISFMQKFTTLMNLSALSPMGETNPKKIQKVESLSHLLHRKALWTLNMRLNNVHAPHAVFATVVDVMNELELDGDIKLRYLDSVIPTLCRHNIFHSMRELTDFAHWHHSAETAETCWSISITLPALIVDRKIPMIISILWRLSTHLNLGWINTECIHFTVKEFNRQFLAGLVEAEQAEKFTYAVIGVLDAFKGNWFSRLHDRELVQAAAGLLTIFDTYSDFLRRELIKVLIRNYGLVPEFWQIIDHDYSDFRDIELDRAKTHWQHIRETIENSEDLHGHLDQVLQPLSYFQVMGNPETAIFLRDIIMNCLVQFNGNLSPAAQALIGLLVKDTPEGLRLGAFPLKTPADLHTCFPESNQLLLQTLRTLSPNPGSVFYQAQTEAGKLIQTALQARNNQQALADTLKKLRHHATILNNTPSQHLSVDILIFAYELGRSVGLAKDINLHTATEKIGKIIAETKEDLFLPVPVQAAIFRLHRYKDDVIIRAFLADIQNRMQEKFKDSYDFLFETPPTHMLSPHKIGFPTDTLVVIYSCRKYLDTRIPAIRNTWVQDLNARNIPYLVLVGDGDGTVSGDVLALNVSDKYEDLPQKTLKLFDWVMDNTPFHYVYKIDDDCYLDVPRFFDSLTYRKHLYYGRVIKRPIGGMDRTWHQSKSHTPHAQKVLDKSPEPSLYADGGGGYVLSRYAMMQLQKNARTEAGQRLIAISLMEDKLVGDLLTLSNISPSNEDYESYQRRRTFGEAQPVGMFDNLFYPSPVTPTVMTHLDTERDQQQTHERRLLAEIWPKKVWPTGSALLIKAKKTPEEGIVGSNQLELLNTPKHLNKLLSNPLAVVVVVRNEMIMLPHFLNHYRQQGVRCFLMVDNLSDDGTREYLLEQPDVGLFSADTEYKNSHYGVAWQQALLGNFCLNKWVLLADADELLVYPKCEKMPLAKFIASVEREGADCIRTDMVDMYPYDNLDDADFTVKSPFTAAKWFDATPFAEWQLGKGFFSNAPGLLSNLRHRITPVSDPNAFTAQKYGLLRYKPWMRLSQGIHDAAGVKVATQGAWFAHFKYHAAFKHKVETEILRGQHFDNAKEYIRYAEILAESKGGFGEANVSICYEGSAELSALVHGKK